MCHTEKFSSPCSTQKCVKSSCFQILTTLLNHRVQVEICSSTPNHGTANQVASNPQERRIAPKFQICKRAELNIHITPRCLKSILRQQTKNCIVILDANKQSEVITRKSGSSNKQVCQSNYSGHTTVLQKWRQNHKQPKFTTHSKKTGVKALLSYYLKCYQVI